MLTFFVQMLDIRIGMFGCDVRVGKQSGDYESRQSVDVRIIVQINNLSIDGLKPDSKPEWIVGQNQV